jgi:hypothetical protein
MQEAKQTHAKLNKKTNLPDTNYEAYANFSYYKSNTTR